MSVDIAKQLRTLSAQAASLAERPANTNDKRQLAAIADELIRIAEKLERDALD